MLTIGQLAERAGVTRRMLRHWDETGVLVPAAVDERSGHREYADRQVAHVQAIVELRSLDFGLDDIRALLDAESTTQRLRKALRERERQLDEDLAIARSRLDAVRARLRALDDDRDRVGAGLTITPLPAVEILGVREVVHRETEIPGAVGRLRARLPDADGDADGDADDLLLVYDGTTDRAVIEVVLGVEAVRASSPTDIESTVSLPSADAGARTRFPTAPSSIGDAWRAIDDELMVRGYRAIGPYRQISHADGAVTLATPIVPDDDACAARS